jgi:type VI secretion system secreted protein Hcp
MVILKIDGIPGQYPGNKVEGDLANGIELTSVQFGANTDLTKSAGTISAGTGKFQTITFTKALDKATGPLMSKCATGEYIKSARIYYLRTGSAAGMYVTLKVELTNIVVSLYSLSGSSGGADPSEVISFSPAKLQMTYRQLLPDGNNLGAPVPAGWDISRSQSI